MKSSRVEKGKKIRDVRNLARLKKETNGTAIKDVRKLSRVKK